MIGETVNIRAKMREAGGQGAGGPVFGFQAATGLVIPTHTHTHKESLCRPKKGVIVLGKNRKRNRKKQKRRDRRKAKQSGFVREGTRNPKKVGHHSNSGLR